MTIIATLRKSYEAEKQNHDKISEIVESLFFLKVEAEKAGNEDVEVLIQSIFNILITTYCQLMREKCIET